MFCMFAYISKISFLFPFLSVCLFISSLPIANKPFSILPVAWAKKESEREREKESAHLDGVVEGQVGVSAAEGQEERVVVGDEATAVGRGATVAGRAEEDRAVGVHEVEELQRAQLGDGVRVGELAEGEVAAAAGQLSDLVVVLEEARRVHGLQAAHGARAHAGALEERQAI